MVSIVNVGICFDDVKRPQLRRAGLDELATIMGRVHHLDYK